MKVSSMKRFTHLIASAVILAVAAIAMGFTVTTALAQNACSRQNAARQACISRCDFDTQSGSLAQRRRNGVASQQCAFRCPDSCDNDGTPSGARRNAR